MSEWTDKVQMAARSGLPYIDNETSYFQMRDQYGFEFDDNLTPIRGQDRNYAVGPLARGWWCFYYRATRSERNRRTTSKHGATGSSAALQKGRTSGYGGGFLPEISYTMNLLPFLPDGAQAVAEQLRLLNPASHAGIAEHWVKVFRPAYGQITKIVCWATDGSVSGEIEPNRAIDILEEAFAFASINTTPRATATTTAIHPDDAGKPTTALETDVSDNVLRIKSNDRDNTIIAIMTGWTGPLNGKGRPRPRDINAAHPGLNITKAERNRLWAVVKKG